MPTTNPVFWFGIALIGASLPAILSRYKWLSLPCLGLGIAGVGYSLYEPLKGGITISIPVWVYLLVLTWVVIGLDFWDRRRGRSALTIYSATYGSTPQNEIDVAELLRREPRSGLVIPINNVFFRKDPAPGIVKRLRVEYSFGNHNKLIAESQEGTHLVLPIFSQNP